MRIVKNAPTMLFDDQDTCIIEWDVSEWQAEYCLGELQLTRIKKAENKVITIGEEVKALRR